MRYLFVLSFLASATCQFGCSPNRVVFRSAETINPQYAKIVVDMSAMSERYFDLNDKGGLSGQTRQEYRVRADVLIVVKPLPAEAR